MHGFMDFCPKSRPVRPCYAGSTIENSTIFSRLVGLLERIAVNEHHL